MNRIRSLVHLVALISTISCVRSSQRPPIAPVVQTKPPKPHAPLKVLLMVEPTPFNYISGYANRFKETLRHLQKYGDEVHIITPDDAINPPTSFLSYPITTLHGFRLPFYKDISLSFDVWGRGSDIIKKVKPDLIHVTSPGFLAFRAMYYAWRYNIPLLMSYHTHLAEYAKKYVPLPGIQHFAHFLLRSHNRADLTLVTSPQLADEVKKIGMQRVDIWKKGIDTEVFSPNHRNESLHRLLAPEGQKLLLYVGRLGIEKNLDRLKAVLDENPDAKLILVGRGPAESFLRDVFKDNQVEFLGQITGTPLSQLYASCDIFVMPSESETLGFVVLEAMASGLPVIGVAAGGVVDLISHNKTGYLTPSNKNMHEFSYYISKLMQHTELRKSLGSEARRWASQFSWEKATEHLRNVQYRKAIMLHSIRRKNFFRRHVKEYEKRIMNEL